MSPRIRLLAALAPDGESCRFTVLFAAPAAGDVETCAAAVLETGDGQTLNLGILCSPTPVTWRSQERFFLADHRYPAGGPYTALLRWGALTAQAVTPDLTAPRELDEATPPGLRRAAVGEGPTVTLFAVNAVADEPNRRRIKLQAAGLATGQRVRVDGGVGQVEWLTGADSPNPAGEWLFDYPKPGRYTVAVDLLDGEGFWLATLAETPLEIIPPPDAAYPGLSRPTVREAPTAEAEAPAVAVQEAATDRPWLPYRNYRPTWGWTYLYTQPGGNVISRTAWAGTYLTARAEAVVGGERWFRTAGGDWVAAGNVTLMEPSELRGVELSGATPPPPPPPPPPPAARRGVVTADVLNVRARPGVRADNPPIDRLFAGTEVGIYEEAPYGDAVWYRIGEGRWVHSGWVRLIETPPPPEPGPPPVTTRRGVVTADALNVRGRPGVRADNPPIAVLYNGAAVTIYEETPVDGVPWYRIGEGRWVHSGWVRITATRAGRATAAESGVSLPVGWIVAEAVNVRRRPGVADDNPPLYQVRHNQVVPVLEEATVGGDRWYRIGPDQWVAASWVGVARPKARPAAIGPTEQWVAVNLSEQTAVAYEGDRPVYAMLVATGLPGTPTVQGIFRTWARLDTGVMAGPGYYIEDVTWTCYFYAGYGLHTAYWHDAFGRPRSHGCVNLSPYDAWWIYRWSAAGGPNSPAVYVYWT